MASLDRLGISISTKVTDDLVEDGVRLFAEPSTSCSAPSSASAQAILGGQARSADATACRSRSTRDVDAALEDWRHERQAAPALGARCDAVDRGRRGEMARLARHRRRPARGSCAAPGTRGRGEAGGAVACACCSAWADRASGPRCSRRPSAGSRAPPSCSSSIRPTRRRSAPSRSGSISRRRSSSCRASRAARSSPTSSSSISSSAPRRRSAPRKRASISSRSPIPARSWRRSPKQDGFRHIFHGDPAIGGRYSVLSDFGMVPAAAMGLDVADFLGKTADMVRSCGAGRAAAGKSRRHARRHPGRPGQARARQGHDRRPRPGSAISAPGSSSCSPNRPASAARASSRSTTRRSGAPEVYGTDRLFAYLRLDDDADPAQDRAVDALERAGHPVVRIALADRSTCSARSSSAGRSRPRSPARSSASIRSTSPTSRRARSRRAS